MPGCFVQNQRSRGLSYLNCAAGVSLQTRVLAACFVRGFPQATHQGCAALYRSLHTVRHTNRSLAHCLGSWQAYHKNIVTFARTGPAVSGLLWLCLLLKEVRQDRHVQEGGHMQDGAAFLSKIINGLLWPETFWLNGLDLFAVRIRICQNLSWYT